jgi:hypothetical protein
MNKLPAPLLLLGVMVKSVLEKSTVGVPDSKPVDVENDKPLGKAIEA